MIEEKAKTKWCPFVRFSFPPIPGGDGLERWNNRDSSVGNGESEASCIGSQCMAWREYPDPKVKGTALRSSGEYIGYCGLAGKP